MEGVLYSGYFQINFYILNKSFLNNSKGGQLSNKAPSTLPWLRVCLKSILIFHYLNTQKNDRTTFLILLFYTVI